VRGEQDVGKGGEGRGRVVVVVESRTGEPAVLSADEPLTDGVAPLLTRALIGRANYATALVDGTRVGRPGPMDALGLARRHGERDVVAFYTRSLLGAEPTPAWRSRLTAGIDPKPPDEAEAARRTVALILAMPEAQVG